ncbi:MAG: hypothetical protein QME96_06730 [Myxococcota bacterium]|nr:hypothetical protein [Myxococcota bacterium]
MKRNIVLSVAFVAVAFVGRSALAQPRPGEGPPRPPPIDRIIAEHAQEMGIDAAVVADIQALVDAAKPGLDALHEQLRQVYEEGGTAQEFLRIQRTLWERQRALIEAIQAMLTPEQWERLIRYLPPPPFPPPAPRNRQ